MQPVNIGNIALTSQAAYTSAMTAGVLPKTGEAAPHALIPPVEEVNLSESPPAIRQEPVVYEKPQNKVQSQAKQATQESEAAVEADDAQASEQVSRSEELALKEEQAKLQELKQRDQEVRAHEQAHMALGGQHAGGASYEFQTGPDGVRYAVGGEVPIDISEVADDPQATLEKMMLIQRAALAPAEPSSQDRQVAAQAGQIAAQAMNELAEESRQQRTQEAEELKARQDKVQQEKDEARAEQEKADKKEQQSEHVSMAERFAEYNAKLRRVNETLLELSAPKPANVGQLLNDLV